MPWDEHPSRRVIVPGRTRQRRSDVSPACVGSLATAKESGLGVHSGEGAACDCRRNLSHRYEPNGFSSSLIPVYLRLGRRDASCIPRDSGSYFRWSASLKQTRDHGTSTRTQSHRSTGRHTQMRTRLQAKREDPLCPKARVGSQDVGLHYRGRHDEIRPVVETPGC